MYFFASILVLGISFFLFRRVAGTLSLYQPNLISWIFYFQLFLQSFVASVMVVYGVDNHYLIGRLSHSESRFEGWLAIQYTMLMMPLGMTVMMWLFKKKNNKVTFKSYCKKKISNSVGRDVTLRTFFYILSCICLFSVIYTYAKLSANPFLAILSLDAEALARLAIMNAREFTGNLYVKNILALLLTPILSYVAYGYYKKSKAKEDKYWFIVMLTASVSILFYNLSKAPIIQYGLGFIFISILLGKVISKAQLIKYFICFVFFILTLYLFLSSSSGIGDLLLSYNSGIWGRIFLSQSAGTFFSFDLFPDTISHIGFDSFSKLLGGGSERSARLIMEEVSPENVRLGIAGVINSLFIGEAWANFGLWGVLLSPFLVGMEVQFIYQKLIMGKKTPLKIALYTYFVFSIPITGGFNDFIYNPTWFLLFIILGGGYQLALIQKKYFRN